MTAIAPMIGIVVLALTVAYAYWKPNAVLFMIAGAMAMFSGLYWPGGAGTGMGFVIGSALVFLAIFFWALAIRYVFWPSDEGAVAEVVNE